MLCTQGVHEVSGRLDMFYLFSLRLRVLPDIYSTTVLLANSFGLLMLQLNIASVYLENSVAGLSHLWTAAISSSVVCFKTDFRHCTLGLLTNKEVERLMRTDISLHLFRLLAYRSLRKLRFTECVLKNIVMSITIIPSFLALY